MKKWKGGHLHRIEPGAIIGPPFEYEPGDEVKMPDGEVLTVVGFHTTLPITTPGCHRPDGKLMAGLREIERPDGIRYYTDGMAWALNAEALAAKEAAEKKAAEVAVAA